jgi:hypothetical protein
LKKPKRSDVAYQFWREHKTLYTKPVNSFATWTNEHTKSKPESGHLFIWGQSTSFENNGRTLVRMKNVDTGGGPSDGHIDHGISDEDKAFS